MELEEMQTVWSQMSDQLEKQKKLTDKIILDMTQEKYKNKFNKMSTYESLGALVLFVAALLILINFNKLDTWYLLTCGIIVLAYIVTIPTMVLRSLHSMKRLNIATNNYKETLIEFTKKKSHLLFVQRLGISLNFVIMIAFLPVASKLMSGKDIFIESNILYWYVPVMAIVLFFFSRWGYKCYKNITASAENLLLELEDSPE